MAKTWGEHLRIVRIWMQHNTRNGSTVTWGSDDDLGTLIRPRHLEEIAQQLADHYEAKIEELKSQVLSRQDAALCVEGLELFEDHRAKGGTLRKVVELRIRLADQFKLTNDDF